MCTTQGFTTPKGPLLYTLSRTTYLPGAAHVDVIALR